MNGCLVFNVAPDLVDIQVRVMLEVLRQSMVLLDDGVKDGGEVLVGVRISGVDTAVLERQEFSRIGFIKSLIIQKRLYILRPRSCAFN
jgi:hypothetical protein